MCTSVDVNSSTFGWRLSFEPQNCLWLPQKPIMGITGFIAFLSTTFICLFIRLTLVLECPACCLLEAIWTSLAWVRGLAQGRRLSTAPTFLYPIRAPLFYHLKAKGSLLIHLSVRIELPPFNHKNKKECVYWGYRGCISQVFQSKVWETHKDENFENNELYSEIRRLNKRSLNKIEVLFSNREQIGSLMKSSDTLFHPP